MSPELADWIASVREWASQPGAVIHTVRGKRGSIPIFPDDVIGKTDDELLAFIRQRCDEQ